MNNRMVHLVVVWPLAIPYYKNVIKKLTAQHAVMLCAVRLYPTHKDLEDFIAEIYSGSQYDLLRINEKKKSILLDYNSEIGVISLIFSVDHNDAEWNKERGRLVYPDVLITKDQIRSIIQNEIGNISEYETIHMTDDIFEFENDFLCLMKMMCLTKYEFCDFEGDF